MSQSENQIKNLNYFFEDMEPRFLRFMCRIVNNDLAGAAIYRIKMNKLKSLGQSKGKVLLPKIAVSKI
jgi:hypothetical protein